MLPFTDAAGNGQDDAARNKPETEAAGKGEKIVGGFFKTPNRLSRIFGRVLGRGGIGTLTAIATELKGKPYCDVSAVALAELLACDRTTILADIEKLEWLGLLIVESTKGRPHRISLPKFDEVVQDLMVRRLLEGDRLAADTIDELKSLGLPPPTRERHVTRNGQQPRRATCGINRQVPTETTCGINRQDQLDYPTAPVGFSDTTCGINRQVLPFPHVRDEEKEEGTKPPPRGGGRVRNILEQ